MEDDFEAPEIWDEFQWEKFLQEQEQNTQKYFQLMEKYLDDPERDQKIAAEMGWDWDEEEGAMAELDALMAEELAIEAEESEGEEDGLGTYFQTPVYAEMVQLHHAIEVWMESRPELAQNALAVTVAAKTALCSAKLAAALSQESDEEEIELGMVLAYLKRAMQAINESIEAEWQLGQAGEIEAEQHEELKRLLFNVRNQIVDLMRETRSEWRRRFGPAN